MENAFGILWGIALVAGIIVFLDWRGRRKDRQVPSSRRLT
jgi:hypothetical protein